MRALIAALVRRGPTVLACGVGLGLLVPALADLARPLMPVTVFLFVLGTLLRVEPSAVRAVARLHRARALVLAGALMGGDISNAVREIREAGILVLCTSMAGSVPDAADVVVSDPVEAGVMAVMLIADTAKFSIEHVRGKRF